MVRSDYGHVYCRGRVIFDRRLISEQHPGGSSFPLAADRTFRVRATAAGHPWGTVAGRARRGLFVSFTTGKTFVCFLSARFFFFSNALCLPDPKFERAARARVGSFVLPGRRAKGLTDDAPEVRASGLRAMFNATEIPEKYRETPTRGWGG